MTEEYRMTFTKDLVERAVRTFIQAALAVLAANVAGLTSLDAAKAAGLAACAAGLSAVMSLLAMNIGTPGSASVLKDANARRAESDATGPADPVVPSVDPNQLPFSGTEWE